MAIRTLGDELATEASTHHPSTFDVAVEGGTRALHPIVRDEIYKIAAEGLRNAFRHAHAERIEVEMHHDDEQFRLRVRDNGRGIDKAAVASHETAGHFGLRGMIERVALLGGKLAVWSEVDEGTELELRLPANILYDTIPKRLVVPAVGKSTGTCRRRRIVSVDAVAHTRGRIFAWST